MAKDSHNFLDGLTLPEDIARELVAPTLDDQGRWLSMPSNLNVRSPRLSMPKSVRPRRRARPCQGRLLIPEPYDMGSYSVPLSLGEVESLRSCFLPQDVVEPGSTAAFRLEVTNNGPAEVRLDTVIFGGGYTNGRVIMAPVASLKLNLAPGKTISTPISYRVPKARRTNHAARAAPLRRRGQRLSVGGIGTQ